MVVEYDVIHNNFLFQKLRQSWEEIEKNKTSTGVSAEQMYVFHILCVCTCIEGMFLCCVREGIMYGAGDEGEISQEVIDEQFAIVLSRDYASLIGRNALTQ